MRRVSSESGFTLIEMLVALSVFAIAALALLRLDGFAVATTADLDARLVADLVVQNEAALAQTDVGPIVRGATTRPVTNAGRAFVVTRTVTPTADQRLVRIDLLAIEQGGRGRAALTMVKRVA
ncbi:type II secretion system minor pseudopilin GspI [Sphingomonas sp. LY160]|uniref:type II secretion system minor pseudopilin GspI n=1 Tax=Sphingomonas sp. LY160 TaxID=3095342 RepID=UPI002ADEBF63|nr:type II secretion system minor pseudopilin GspI [Sphingomonas sp. LY160]MEA1072875.1 type II secretion system minor pseudopilin GspI [Sphingomonas sp. LY160]